MPPGGIMDNECRAQVDSFVVCHTSSFRSRRCGITAFFAVEICPADTVDGALPRSARCSPAKGPFSYGQKPDPSKSNTKSADVAASFFFFSI
jgi:hypothetical protein